jgi:hypothetical protein
MWYLIRNGDGPCHLYTPKVFITDLFIYGNEEVISRAGTKATICSAAWNFLTRINSGCKISTNKMEQARELGTFAALAALESCHKSRKRRCAETLEIFGPDLSPGWQHLTDV